MAWGIRNYNAFIANTRQLLDVTYQEARTLYGDLKEGIGRGSLTGADARRHVDDLELAAVMRGFILRAGTELELTATTQGGTPKQR